MSPQDTPAAVQPDARPDPCEVAVEAGCVVLRLPGAEAVVLTPAAAVRTAELLLEAADQALRPASDDHQPPFPPAELVSPHAA